MPIIGIPLALLAGLFCWVGSQSFHDPAERTGATLVFLYCVLLLILSVTSLFVKALRRINSVMTLGLVGIIVLGLALAK